jgi:hypothetical protein
LYMQEQVQVFFSSFFSPLCDFCFIEICTQRKNSGQIF